MKLIIEEIKPDELDFITESHHGQKFHYITGPFMRSEIVNGNGRMYPLGIMEREVEKYNKNYIKEGRAFGELGHPDTPKINLERTSHLIVSLVREGKDFIGKARVMDTPYGKIVQNILEAGGKLGVSSRGLGSLREQNGINVVQDDFELRTAADVVADPSAPDAFVTGLMENVEWIKDEKLGWKALEKAEDYKKYVHKEYKRIDEEKKLNMFKSFLNNL
mgnify:FL=1